jgi:cyclic pyranopterin phosphate synthase
MLSDISDRTIDYMRISITDNCNLRCVYCMPSGGLKFLEQKDILECKEGYTREVPPSGLNLEDL